MNSTDFSKYVGMSTGAGTVVVERAPVTAFAAAVGDTAALYRDDSAARTAGFSAIPAPPTFGFCLQNWGRWTELQPERDPAAPQPVAEVIGALMAEGGLVLHGEQSFEYHRTVVVGDVLHYEGVVSDIYQRESGGRTMTFMVVEDRYTDEAGDAVLTSTMNLLHRSPPSGS